MTHYDVIILGAGSGNTVIDGRFDDQRVAIVERGPLGGTCLNRGCIPSKMYVHPSDLALGADRVQQLGFVAEARGADWPRLRARIVARVDGVAASGRRGREKADNIDLFHGTARFTAPLALEVTPCDQTQDAVAITGDQVVIATGSRPVVPDIPGLADAVHHTSDTVMRLDDLPARIAVLGGGYIGCEFAHVFAAAGAQVVQIEAGDTLLGNEDDEIGERFTGAARQRWDVRLNTSLEKVVAVDGGSRLELSDGSAVEVDLVLVAVGRTPNTDKLGLDLAGVETDDKGLVEVDAHQHTSADGVWSLGDACVGTPLKHVANHEARVVQHNLLHCDDQVESDHRFIPHAVFSHPQVAAVGQTEADARAQGVDLVVGRAEYAATAFGWAMQTDPDDESPEANGLVKVLADRRTGKLVGAHVLGSQASILVQPLIQACALGADARTLARDQYWIHPALSEVVEGALLDLAANW